MQSIKQTNKGQEAGREARQDGPAPDQGYEHRREAAVYIYIYIYIRIRIRMCIYIYIYIWLHDIMLD